MPSYKPEKQAEMVQFASYMTFCQMTSKQKAEAIAETAEQIQAQIDEVRAHTAQKQVEKQEEGAEMVVHVVVAVNSAHLK